MMTKDEALRGLTIGDCRTRREAVKTVKELLNRAVEPRYNSIKTELKPCEDAISRQAAIDAFERFIHELGIEDEPYNYGEMALSAKNVPPVTPQPKTGNWRRELIRNEKGGCIGAKMICSECGNDNKHDEYMTYCPNCGAKMSES